VAAFVEGTPLGGISLKPAAVGRKVVKSEFEDSSFQVPADLTAHFAKAGPAQLALRQRPLEKGHAVVIVHRTAIYARLPTARLLIGRGPTGSVTETGSDAGNVSCKPSSSAFSRH
jgi:hypothetical protein